MPVSLDILIPAFIAGILILATHAPLGRLVLARGIVFIDLAIAQVAGLGVVAADFLGWEPAGWGAQASALTAALIGSAFLVWTEKRFADIQEAIIGVLFAVAASAEIVLLSFNPHGAENLKDLLVGQILWVTPAQLIPVAVLYAIVLGVLATQRLAERRILFYVVFALTVTASVQLVGVFLVFASLIIPALAGRRRPGMRGLIHAYGVGAAGYTLGLFWSAIWDAPTGAAIVCSLALAGAVKFIIGAARPAGPA